MGFAQLAFAMLQYGPELFSDGEAVAGSIANGEGGKEKIAKATAALATLLGHLAQAAISVK